MDRKIAAGDRAADWLTQAAKQEMPEAQAALAEMLQKGKGVERDCGKSVEWLTRAAGRGYPYAQWKLGAFYMTGTCCKRDLAAAYRWFKTAVDLGYEKAGVSLKTVSSMMTKDEIKKANDPADALIIPKAEPGERLSIVYFITDKAVGFPAAFDSE